MLTSIWRKFLAKGQSSSQRSSPIRRKHPGLRSFRLELELLEERCLPSAAVITDFAIPTAKSGPALVAAGPDGNLWFTESAANKIGMINPTTHAISEFSIPTANSEPDGITAGPDGNVWFAQAGSDQIGTIDVATHVISEYTVPTMNAGPQGIAVGSDGNLWFTETSANQIGVINPSTHAIAEFPIPTMNSHTVDITAGPDGNLWFTESSVNQIGIINPATHAIAEFPVPTPMAFPSGITVAANGTLWFLEDEGNQIGTIDPTTHAISEFTIPTGNSSPVEITAGPDGNLWFTEVSGNQIGTINLGTHAISEFAIPTGLSDPNGITAGPDGNLWFTEGESNKIGEVSIVSNLSALVGNNQSATVGAVFGTRMEAQVVDDFGNPVKGASVIFSETNGYTGAGGTFNGYGLGQTVTATTNAQGLAFGPMMTANHTTGSFTVAARLSAPGDVVTTAFSLTNLPGAPASLSTAGGTPQNTPVATKYANLLQTLVTDGFGNPLANVPVTFTAPNIGASGSFKGLATVPTNALGIATAPTFTANQVQGSFLVTATVASAGIAPVVFNLTNTAVPAAISVVAGTTPQSAVVGQAYATTLKAKVTDATGKPVVGITVVFALPNGKPAGTFAQFAGSASAVTDATGVATAPVLTANTTVGAFTVIASVANVAGTVSFGLTNTAGSAAIVSAPGISGHIESAAVTKAYSPALQALVTDALGNPVGGVTVTFTAPVSGAGVVTGTFVGKTAGTTTNVVTAVSAATGLATAPAFTANTLAGSFTVTAAIAAPGSTPANIPLTNVAGPATKIAANPGTLQTTTVNQSFAKPLQALVTDAFSNPVGNASVTFTAPLPGGASGLFANGTRTATVLTNSAGIAQAPTFTANGIANSFLVTASTTGVTATTSFSMANAPIGPVAKIVAVAGTPQTASDGNVYATPLQALVTDANNNPISGVTVTFSASALAGGASGRFAGALATVTAVTGTTGIAQAPAFTANTQVGAFVVTASVSGLTPTASFSLTNLVGPVAKIVATAGTPQTTTVGSVFATPLQALVTDANNNPISGVAVTFTAPGAGASGMFAAGSGAAVMVSTNTAGIAQAPNFIANGQTGSFVVTASASGLTPISFSLTNAPAQAAKIVATAGTPQMAGVNTSYGTPLQVEVTDVNGNPVAGVVVSFSAPASGASGTFPGGGLATMAMTNSVGIAQAPTFTANATGGGFIVTASVSGVVPSASFSLANTGAAALPTKIVATAGTPQMAGVGTSYGTPLQVEVTDVNGNPVAGVVVSFSAPASGASGTFSGGGLATMAFTNTAGIAQAPTFTANATGGSFIVTASVSGVVSTASFNLANTGATDLPANILVKAGDMQTAAVSTTYGTLFQVEVTDTVGTPLGNVIVTFTAPASTFPSLGASGTFIDTGTATTTASTNSMGIAQASAFTANTQVGGFAVTAATNGVTASFQLSNTNAAPQPANIVVTGGDMQLASPKATFGMPLQVKVTDSTGSPIAGGTVTFTILAVAGGGAGGSFLGGASVMVTTDSNGFASVSGLTANSTTGQFSVQASFGDSITDTLVSVLFTLTIM